MWMTRRRSRLDLLVGVVLVAGGCVSQGREVSELEGGAPLRSGGGGVCATSNSINSVQIAEQRPQHIEEMLNQIPGVTVARVGTGYSVQIRGQNSFTSGAEPLYLIDGMSVSGERAGLLPINPADVECVEVLKDVGYTGAFGTRGTNGVILITTRRAR